MRRGSRREIGREIARVLEADRETDEPVADAEGPRAASGMPRVRHDRRVLGERLDAAEALGAGEDAQRAQERARLRDGPSVLEADHPAGPAHLPRGERVPLVRREARVVDLDDLRVAFEPLARVRALSTCRRMRTPSVLRPRSTR